MARCGWPLGTMVVYGFAPRPLRGQLDLARGLGATHLELYVNWKADPDPVRVREGAAAAGLVVHSVHAAWGTETVAAPRIDLGDVHPTRRTASVQDVGHCLDWSAQAGAGHLVVHPGVASSPDQADARRACLVDSLACLADRRAAGHVRLCIENMPPGVWPGSRMQDLLEVVESVGSEQVGLCLDTGHAHVQDGVVEAVRQASPRLWTTHVHDNNGKRDQHLLPGYGTLDWEAWRRALVEVGYRGVLMLECLAHFRADPSVITATLPDRLADLCRFPHTDPADSRCR